MTKDQILCEALTLDPRERDELAEALWQSILPGELTPQQLAEIHRRIQSVDSGQVQTIPGEQVLQELRQRFVR